MTYILISKIAVIVLALAGFTLANYIRSSKKKEAPLVCPLEGSCEAVVYSKFSKLLGIPLEIWGMTYYAVVALTYLSQIFAPNFLPSSLAMLVMALTIVAFLFSVYLTAIQAVILKHWCTWCLFSAAICTTIFLLVASSSKILNVL